MAVALDAGVTLCFTACLVSCAPTGLGLPEVVPAGVLRRCKDAHAADEVAFRSDAKEASVCCFRKNR